MSPTSPQQLPFVTVIMPVRNEVDYIDRSLKAVLAQNYPPGQMEVLIVDGMSDDGTRDRIRAVAAKDHRVRLLDNPGRIAPMALNIGFREARGNLVVRVDGHCEIDSDYVRKAVELLSDGVYCGVGGPIETIGETRTARAIAIAMSHPFGVGGSAFRSRPDRVEDVDTIAFPAYRRECLERAGPYDEELVRNQDDEYNYRLRELGERLLLSPAMRSRYYSRGTFRKLWRQYFQYGLWKVRVLQKHPRQMRWRQFVPPVFVLGVMTATVLGVLIPEIWWLPIGALGTYLVTCFAIARSAARRHSASWARVGIAFVLLHFGYGCGFLVGLGRFIGRWRDRSRNPHDRARAEAERR